jgi:putative selenium metabolism hydrolase
MGTKGENIMTDVVELAQALIAIPSTTGNEAAIAAYVQDDLAAAGFEVEIDVYGSVIAVRRGQGPVVLFDAHIDTVEAEARAWTHPPFAGQVEDGRVYGRGATDMKGALAAMMAAAHRLVEAHMPGTLILTGTSWEEYFEGYTLGKAIEALTQRGLRPDYCLIGEASEMNIKRGQRGRTRLHFDVTGASAHSAHPEQGINAVYKAVRLIQAIHDMALPTDDFLGESIVELIGIDSQPKPIDSVVPYACRVSYDLRLLPGQTEDVVMGQFQELIAALQAQDPELDITCQIASGELDRRDGKVETVRAFPPAWKLAEDDPLVQRAQVALQRIGQSPEIAKYDFCTNGSYSAGVAQIPTIGYGPGEEGGAHVVDESVSVTELRQAEAGYMAIARALWADGK